MFLHVISFTGFKKKNTRKDTKAKKEEINIQLTLWHWRELFLSQDLKKRMYAKTQRRNKSATNSLRLTLAHIISFTKNDFYVQKHPDNILHNTTQYEQKRVIYRCKNPIA